MAEHMERFVAIDPCLVHRTKSTYLDYLQNEARMLAMADTNQLYGPNWMNYKEKSCAEMKKEEKCEEYFGPQTLEYEPISTTVILHIEQNAIEMRLQRYSAMYHREEGRKLSDVFISKIRQIPIYIHYDSTEDGITCTTK